MDQNRIKEGKTAAITAYFTMLGALIAISMNMGSKNEFARFHIRQAFGIHLLFIAFGILSSSHGNLYSASGLFLSYTVLFFYGFPQRIERNAKTIPIPILGRYFQKWFTFIN